MRRDDGCDEPEAGLVEGERATIPAARLTQTPCGREPEMHGSGERMTRSLRGHSRSRLPGIPFGGRQAGVSLGAAGVPIGCPVKPVATSRMCS